MDIIIKISKRYCFCKVHFFPLFVENAEKHLSFRKFYVAEKYSSIFPMIRKLSIIAL